jgi:hypothetical protein
MARRMGCLTPQEGCVQLVRKYRSPIPLVGGLVVSVGFLLLGIDMLLAAPSGDVGDRVFGAIFIVFACLGVGVVISNGVVLTSAGITCRHEFRRKTIAWEAVTSFRVSPMPGIVPWSTMVVDLQPSGVVRIASIVGTRRYVRQVMSEFEAFRVQYSAAQGDAGH